VLYFGKLGELIRESLFSKTQEYKFQKENCRISLSLVSGRGAFIITFKLSYKHSVMEQDLEEAA
jgi:hypothetical protein